MHKAAAAVGSAAWLVLAPGVVAGLVPWSMTRWDLTQPVPFGLPVRVVGLIIIVAGTVVLLLGFLRFAVEGLGTPAPAAPTRHLVVGGLYRYVRNPMYLAVDAIILGQAIMFAAPVLLWYGLVVALAQGGFVYLYEEPVLRRTFGPEYDAYRQAVGAWLPRLRRPTAPAREAGRHGGEARCPLR